MTHELDVIDPTFLDDLRSSRGAVEVAARWARDKFHYHTILPPVFERESPEERGNYSDNGDMFVACRWEVKRRPDIDFTSCSTFPYDTIIVDVAHSWDNAKPKPRAYLILNKSMTGLLFISASTSSKWTKESRYSKKLGRARDYYICPLSECVYYEIGGGA